MRLRRSRGSTGGPLLKLAAICAPAGILRCAIRPALSKLSRLNAIVTAPCAHGVLVVEDSAAMRELLCGYLRQIGGVTVKAADSLASAQALLTTQP